MARKSEAPSERTRAKRLWHGSSASRMIRKSAGVEVCLTVTLIAGLVLARSGFNHSVNYRSAMLFGRTMAVEDRAEKLRSAQPAGDRDAGVCEEISAG